MPGAIIQPPRKPSNDSVSCQPPPTLPKELYNPYLDEATRAMELPHRFAEEISLRFKKQCELQATHGYAIPTQEALNTIAALDLPVIEIGAGAGYWAFCLKQLGVDVLPVDQAAWNNYASENPPFFDAENARTQWCEIVSGTHELAASYPDRALFLCWPEAAAAALPLYAQAGGKTLIYVGEDRGGASVSESFFDYLRDNNWTLVETIGLPNFPSWYSALQIYRHE